MLFYKVVPRAEPGIQGGGSMKYYANLIPCDTVPLRELANRISKRSTLSTIDIIATLEALIMTIPEYLSEGKIINLGDLGSFRMSIKSTGSTTPEDVSMHNITGNKIIFHPGKQLKESLKSATYRKYNNT